MTERQKRIAFNNRKLAKGVTSPRNGQLYRAASGAVALGQYRGEQAGNFDACELVRKMGYVRIAARMRKHYGMDKKGDISFS